MSARGNAMRSLVFENAPTLSGDVCRFSHTSWLAAVGLTAMLAASPPYAASKVVAIGDASPLGGTFAPIAGISPLLLGTNDRGDVLFWSGVTGGSSSAGVFLFSNGSFTKIVAEQDPSPIGGTFANLSPSTSAFRLNNRGDVAFVSEVDGGSCALSVFLFSAGFVSKIVAWRDQAPDPPLIDPTTDPDIFVPVSGFSIDLNDSGEVAFYAMQGKPVGTSYVSTGAIYLSTEAA